MSMPRLFTGIEIPMVARGQLALLKGGLPGARWIDPENYHLTLRFVGDIDGRMALEIAAILARVRRRTFELRIDGLGSFGSRRPHSLVATVAPSRDLAELQAEHERLMQRLGLPADPRKFTPHITLARLRGAGQRQIADYLSLSGGLMVPPFLVDRFVLFSARESVGGGPYVVEEAYPLAAEAA
jgi:2'-5' RNA ligase